MIFVAPQRWARRNNSLLVDVTRGELERFQSAEMYIRAEICTNDHDKDKACAVKVDHFSVEGMADACLSAFKIVTRMPPAETMVPGAQDIVKEIIDLEPMQAAAFVVELRDDTILKVVFGHRQGYPSLDTKLSYDWMQQNSYGLLNSLERAMIDGELSAHTCDYAENSFGQCLRVEVHAKKTLIWPDARPCWQLAIKVYGSEAVATPTGV
jgi:hypothetical protein